jgi:N-acyl-D-amino-acid deacylase
MADFDLVLRQGLLFDGSGAEPTIGDLAIAGGRIAGLAPRVGGRGARELDVAGLAVSPGFVNMMSWAPETLIEDGRSMSGVMQGVTLEVMGEGTSMGPLTQPMRDALRAGGISGQVDGFRYPVEWTTLWQYLEWLEQRGVAVNVASFVGAGTLREHEIGYADRPASDFELQRMCALLDDEMRHGAVGVASALIYPPETSYSIAELTALARVAAAHGGMYASHVRGEGAALLEAVAELIEIARNAGARAEVYHLKAAGRAHWHLLPAAIALIEEARDACLAVTADVYPYEYSGTSLGACIPPWAHEGGPAALRARLDDAAARGRMRADMARPGWENPMLDAGPEHIQVRGPLGGELARFSGLSLADVAEAMGTTPEDAAMDLVRDNRGDVFALYFDMDPSDVRLVAARSWVSFCSDAESLSSEAAERDGAVHPRAFGAFARVLGRFVREEGIVTLAEAVRRMTSLPAENLRLTGRGRLQVGYAADVAVFDPASVADRSTPEVPHAYAVGMVHVLVNGTPVLLDGAHTGATPGRFVRGPGSRPS